jgi:hypothetical protein
VYESRTSGDFIEFLPFSTYELLGRDIDDCYLLPVLMPKTASVSKTGYIWSDFEKEQYYWAKLINLRDYDPYIDYPDYPLGFWCPICKIRHLSKKRDKDGFSLGVFDDCCYFCKREAKWAGIPTSELLEHAQKMYDDFENKWRLNG